ncbi:MAG TPA: DsrE family protein [Acidisphaera sp.]|nr:DsrE family protein [Acidisphaera sp.]
MPQFARRSLFPAAASVVLVGAGAAPAGYYADQKVVYHNDGRPPDNTAYFGMLLANLRNHLAAVGPSHVMLRIVNLGPGVDLLIAAQQDKPMAHAIDALRADGAVFLVCNNTLNARNLDWRTLYGVQEGDVVPSGVAELGRLQAMGFAYIHP